MKSMLISEETKKIFVNTAWMIFDKVFILLLNLLVTVRIANHFGATEYGNYQYVVNIVAVFEVLVTFVDARVVKKQYPAYRAEIVVYNATICRMIFSVISAFVGIIFIVLQNKSRTYSIMFAILLIDAIIKNLRFGMANRFEYLLKSKNIVIAADISAIFSSLLQLLAVQFNLSIISISVIVAFSSLINLLIIIIQYRTEFRDEVKGHFSFNLLQKMIMESFPLAIAASCATIYTRSDSIMLGAMLTTAEVGIYSIAAKLITVVQIVIAPVRESVYPKLITLYGTDKKKYANTYIQISSMLTWIYIIGVIISLGILPIAFKFLNSEYMEAFSVYKIYVIGTFFMYNSALRAGHYTLVNKGYILMYSQIISVFLNIVMNYVLIIKLGIYGAAIATAITQGISLLVSNLFFGKDGRELFIWQLKSLNPLRIFKN